MKGIASKSLLGAAALLLAVMLFPKGALALTVSPVMKEYHMNPGNVVMDVIQIINETNIPKTVYPLRENFYAKGEDYGAEFYPADEDPYGTALAQWMTIENEGIGIRLEPGDRANVQYSIRVPENGSPGGHFGTVIMSDVPPEVARAQGSSLGTKPEIAVMLFVRVSGDITEDGSIAEFGFKKPQAWYNYLPVDFFLRFENKGNVHLRPTGNLFIKNMFGKQVASLEVNAKFLAVFPKSIRRFDFGWQKTDPTTLKSEIQREWNNFAIGRYKATLVAVYSIDNKMVTDERVFWVWPWRLMLIFGIGLSLLILIGWIWTKARRKMLIKAYIKRSGKVGADRAAIEAEMRVRLEKEIREKIEREMGKK